MGGATFLVTSPQPACQSKSGINDLTAREGMWRRFDGDDWAAFDALPAPIRQRLHEHAYDAWAVNALMLWRTFRRRHACSMRATNTLLRYLKQCEGLERAAFAESHLRAHGTPLPHVAASVSVLRYDSALLAGGSQSSPGSAAGAGPGQLDSAPI